MATNFIVFLKKSCCCCFYASLKFFDASTCRSLSVKLKTMDRYGNYRLSGCLGQVKMVPDKENGKHSFSIWIMVVPAQ